MSPAVRAYVVACYPLPFAAEEVAFCANMKFRLAGAVKAKDVEVAWAAARGANPVLRELGERPARGFTPSPATALAARLLEAA